MTVTVATADDLEQQAAARRELARIVQQHDRTIETLADRLQGVVRGHEALSGSFDRLAASGTVAQDQRNLITDRLDAIEANLARLLHPSRGTAVLVPPFQKGEQIRNVDDPFGRDLTIGGIYVVKDCEWIDADERWVVGIERDDVGDYHRRPAEHYALVASPLPCVADVDQLTDELMGCSEHKPRPVAIGDLVTVGLNAHGDQGAVFVAHAIYEVVSRPFSGKVTLRGPRQQQRAVSRMTCSLGRLTVVVRAEDRQEDAA